MTATYTLDVVRTIRRNAGTVPPEELAHTLGWSVGQLTRVAAKHHIDLRMLVMRVYDDPPRRDPVKLPPSPPRLPASEKLGTQIGIRLRAADEKIIREKAAARFVLAGKLLRQVIEGVISRGKIDEMANAARFYRPGDVGEGGDAE